MANRLLKLQHATLLATGIAVFTFLFDLTQPRGVAGGMPYVALPLLGLLARSSRMIVVAAGAGIMLALVGYWLSPSGAVNQLSLFNRSMSIALICIIAIISVRHLAIGERLRESLRQQATRDPLTGLFNRRHVFSIVENELNRFKRYREPFSLILIDADHFKRVNDTYGHPAGDAVLREIARVCTSMVRTTDVVGRFGGEEFIILLPHTKVAKAAIVAERIRRKMLETRPKHGDRRISVTLSLGVTEARPGAESFDELLQAADEALYAAKDAGRDCVAVKYGARKTTRFIRAA